MKKPKNKKEFTWTDKLVKEFAKVSTLGSYGIYENAKSIDKKLKIFKMDKEGLISENTAIVKFSDIAKNGNNLSAEFHINRLKGKYPYILKDGLYERIESKSYQIKNAEYYTPQQAKEVNNLLNAKKHIDIEIENIKKPKKSK